MAEGNSKHQLIWREFRDGSQILHKEEFATVDEVGERITNLRRSSMVIIIEEICWAKKNSMIEFANRNGG